MKFELDLITIRYGALRRLFFGFVLFGTLSICSAATIEVGPGGQVRRIADAARMARDGDTVLVAAGVYRGDVAVWHQRQLEIRSVGGKSTLIADGQSAEGKAIWVFRKGDFRIKDFEFTGTRTASGNGAGIRFEAGRLELANCYFHDNQMGLLTGNDPDSVLRIRDSVFSDAPRQQNPLPHLLYVGRIAHFEISGSRFENGYWGHLLKSRARESVIRYNLIADGPVGRASYEIDLPNGGKALLVGNIVGQNALSENKAVIAYGAERLLWPENELTVAHNTLVSQAIGSVQFIRTWLENPDQDDRLKVRVRKNLVIGEGVLVNSDPDGLEGNVHLDISRPATIEPDHLLRLAQRYGIDTVTARRDDPLAPFAQFAEPWGTSSIEEVDDLLPGALQK